MSGEQNGGLDLSAVIGKLTENPALLSGLISSLSKPPEPVEKPPEVPSTPQIDPDAMSKLLPVMSMLGGLGSPQSSGGPPKQSNPRCELLSALRPFLSPSRCEAIDYMIKMDGLSGILRGMKKQ